MRVTRMMKPHRKSPLPRLARAGALALSVGVGCRDTQAPRLEPDPPSQPARPFSAATYARISPPTATGTSRLVFDGNGSVSLQSQWSEFGYFEHRGSYAVADGGIELTFGVVGCCLWTATVVSHDDSLFVTHVNAPDYPSIEDGLYVRTQPPAAPGDAAGRVAFNGTIDGEAGIYSANPDGSGLTRLTEGTEPAWSWDGRAIAYAHAREGDPLAIYTMAVDGSDPVALGEGHAPDWSPDGTRIVFSLDSGIAVMNVDGSNRRTLISLASPGMPAGVTELRRPTWSPDGQRIAFESREGPGPTVLGAIQIHIMDADGSNLRLLSDDGLSKYNAAWSPDGARIAAQTYDEVSPTGGGYRSALASYDVGSGRRQVIYGTLGGWLTDGPEYTPDGRYLAFGQQSWYELPHDLTLMLDLGSGAVYPLLPGTNATNLAWSRGFVPSLSGEVYQRMTASSSGGRSRYVLYEPDRFELQYVTDQWGSFAYPGRYARVDSQIRFLFDANYGEWDAIGTLRGAGDSLVVTYNLDMQLSDFENGVYVREARLGRLPLIRPRIPPGSP